MSDDKSYAYIKVYKGFSNSVEMKDEEGRFRKFNIMRLPKGVVIGNKDLSNARINPFVMFEDKINPNMMVARYDREKITDNAVTVNIPIGGGKFEKLRVDVDVLSQKVNEANRNYLREKKLKKHETEEAISKEIERTY